MPVQSRGEAQTPAQHPRALVIYEATASWIQSRSCRGLLCDTFLLRRCPRCSESHIFRAAGYRVAPCGARVLLRRRRAWGTSPAQQIQPGTDAVVIRTKPQGGTPR